MNSSRIRYGFAATLVVIAVLVFVPSLLALAKQKTSGTQFSIVQGTGTADNVADGRRFRGQHEPLKIRGTLSVPTGTHSQPQKMSRLAIHFHTSSTGPTLRSVQLCDVANCKYKYVTNLKGGYSVRETQYTKDVQYGNAWVFNPPEVAGSQFAVVLEVSFPGLIDEGTFPPNFAAAIDNVVVWNNGKAYFFKGSEYIRYDIATDKTDEGPVPIIRNWHGLW